MYNERRDSFSLKDVILQVLFVVLFVFLLMWLFPSKQFVKDTVQPLYDRIFVENILIMKDAAKGYYRYWLVWDKYIENQWKGNLNPYK